MRDIDKRMREALMSALDETITYNGELVPCSDEMEQDETKSVYILLNTQTDEDDPNKAKFFHIGTILIDAVHLSGADFTYDVVDTVADEIMQILQPTPQTHGLTSPSGFQIVNLRRLSSNRLPIPSVGNNVMRRLLRYEYKVVEN